MIDDIFDLRRAAQAGFLALGQHFLQQMIVLRLLRRRINQTRIRGRIPWLEIFDRLEVARVRDDHGKFLELLELTQLRFALLRFDSGCAHDFASS